MNRLLVLLALGALVARPASGAPLAPETYEVFVLIAQPTPELLEKGVSEALATLVGATLPEGTPLHFFVTSEQRAVGACTIPSGSRASRLREKGVRKAFAGLARELARTEPARDAQIGITRLPNLVAATRMTTRPVWLVLVGDPLYHDEGRPRWSMRGALVPSDSSATEAPSPLAMGGPFPAGTRVNWLVSPWSPDVADDRRLAVERFWRIWFQVRSSTLERFTTDPAAAFTLGLPEHVVRVEPKADPVGMIDSGYRDTDTGAVREGWEMSQRSSQLPSRTPATEPAASSRDLTPIERTPTVVPSPPADAKPPTPAPSLADRVSATPLLDDEETFDLSIAWTSPDPHCDLDLRVVSSEGEELGRLRGQTSFGDFHGDVTRGGVCNRCQTRQGEWERVTLRVDRLGTLVAWINAYSTTAPAEVVAELHYQGKRRTKTFTIGFTEGDGAMDGDRRDASPAWVRLNLPQPPSRYARLTEPTGTRSILQPIREGGRDDAVVSAK